jgi:hypothetical protein
LGRKVADDLRPPLGPIFAALGVPATVTRPAPDNAPIETTGVWISPDTMEFPVGTDFQRKERQYLIAFMRREVPTVPRASVVVAPKVLDGPRFQWLADGVARADDPDMHYVIVVPATEES